MLSSVDIILSCNIIGNRWHAFDKVIEWEEKNSAIENKNRNSVSSLIVVNGLHLFRDFRNAMAKSV